MLPVLQGSSAPPKRTQKKRGLAGAVGLGAALSMAAAQQASAATELAQVAASDNRCVCLQLFMRGGKCAGVCAFCRWGDGMCSMRTACCAHACCVRTHTHEVHRAVRRTSHDIQGRRQGHVCWLPERVHCVRKCFFLQGVWPAVAQKPFLTVMTCPKCL